LSVRIERNDVFCSRVFMNMLGMQLAEPFIGLCVMGEGTHVKGLVVFNDMANGNVEMSAIGKGCWSPPVIRWLARLVFRDLRCCRVTARTRASNARAVRSLEKMGFVREGEARHWYRDGDSALLFGLLATEQKLVK